MSDQPTGTGFEIDLRQLARHENEQIEWKEDVASCDDVVATLSAFANDLQNMGGGYVVCGAREGKDGHGFQQLHATGLTASRLREVAGTVLTRCRERVSPSIAPRIVELLEAAAALSTQSKWLPGNRPRVKGRPSAQIVGWRVDARARISNTAPQVQRFPARRAAGASETQRAQERP